MHSKWRPKQNQCFLQATGPAQVSPRHMLDMQEVVSIQAWGNINFSIPRFVEHPSFRFRVHVGQVLYSKCLRETWVCCVRPCLHNTVPHILNLLVGPHIEDLIARWHRSKLRAIPGSTFLKRVSMCKCAATCFTVSLVRCLPLVCNAPQVPASRPAPTDPAVRALPN